MKKHIGVFITITALLIASLTACGSTNAGNAAYEEPSKPVEEADAETVTDADEDEDEEETADAAADVNAQADGNQSDGGVADISAAEDVKLSTKTTIEETVLFEDENVRITAVSLEFKYNSPHLKLKFENNGDEALSFVSGSMGYSCNSINGYMVDGLYTNVDVEPGKTALEETYVSEDLLNILGIRKISEIGMGFDITNSDYDEYAKTGPLFIKTSDAEGYDDSADTFISTVQSGAAMAKYGFTVEYVDQSDFLQQEELAGICSCLITNKDGEKSLFLETENKTDEVLNLAAERISINGVTFVSSSWSSDTIVGGKKRVTDISLDNVVRHAGGTLHDFGLDDISEIGVQFKCYDENRNDYFTKDVLFTISGSGATPEIADKEVYNENGVRLSFGKILKDEYDHVNIILLAENNSSDEVDLDVDYGSLSLNGTMTGFIAYSLDLEPGSKGILCIEISKYELEDAGISGTDDIKEAEFRLEIRDENYHEIGTAIIKVEK